MFGEGGLAMTDSKNDSQNQTATRPFFVKFCIVLFIALIPLSIWHFYLQVIGGFSWIFLTFLIIQLAIDIFCIVGFYKANSDAWYASKCISTLLIFVPVAGIILFIFDKGLPPNRIDWFVVIYFSFLLSFLIIFLMCLRQESVKRYFGLCFQGS